MPSPAHSGSDEPGGGDKGAYNHNVHISINRRIQMPPAFHFPEDQAPPSDLIAAGGASGHDFSKDVADHAAMYPMMNQIYKEFDHLSMEEKSQLLARTLEEEDDYPQAVPEFESDSDSGRPKPKGIIRDDIQCCREIHFNDLIVTSLFEILNSTSRFKLGNCSPETS